ncbi:hypothetical protein J4402_05650 [Candidatus Pacearchaeota archaeon]|nr:hypothetical protein [Candidatus Pacearchaeota archaeon]
MKRKKRLEKGIESLQKQIEIHKEKLKKAIDGGDEDLARYYEKDLARLEGEEIKKKEKLER